MGYEVEVLVIDGNSKDKTVEIASGLGAKVIVEPRKGYGRAYKTGFELARGDILITLDADGTYPSEKIPEYLTYFVTNKLDFLTINRFGHLEEGAMILSHKVGNWILSATLRILFNLGIKDSQSGMWILKRSIMQTIKPESDGMAFSEEIKVRAFKNFKAGELDGEYKKRVGEVKLQTINDGLRNFKYLWWLRRNYKRLVQHEKIEYTEIRS